MQTTNASAMTSVSVGKTANAIRITTTGTDVDTTAMNVGVDTKVMTGTTTKSAGSAEYN